MEGVKTEYFFVSPDFRARWHIAKLGELLAVCGFARPLDGWEAQAIKVRRSKTCLDCRKLADAWKLPLLMTRTLYNGSGVSKSKRLRILIRDDYKCVYCQEPVSFVNSTLDHVHPHSKGGRERYSNLVTACDPCNIKRGNRPIAEFCPEAVERIEEQRHKEVDMEAIYDERWAPALEVIQ